MPEVDLVGLRDAVVAQLGEGVVAATLGRGELTLVVRREGLVEVCRWLRDDPAMAFDRLSDLTGVDYLTYPRPPQGERFAVVYHLHSLRTGRRLRLRVPVAAGDSVVPSVVEIWPTADWHERETFDLFGIRFDGHPDLRRILLPDDWQGHPLRKDVPIGGEEVEFSYNVRNREPGRG
ncbi:MAG: NADH-quinone oxidoreductase subunit C [Chloroflexi bacterium]|nr:NADH-quinone oxidoreductase subunit C [Chloroflexota bacterium]